jgi:superoxide dismutase, Cu-Zn family
MKFQVFLLATVLGLATASADMHAKARLSGKSGSKVKGTVEFMDIEGGSVKVTYNLSNLPKNQTLGMHIHEMGDCTSKDGKSAGKHFAQMETTGGTSTSFPEKYAGDLPSITSDSKGKAKGSFVATHLTITGNNAISKRSIVIHGGPDDVSSPSAERIACGVIVGPPVKVE